MQCERMYEEGTEGLVLFDGTAHAEYWCKLSCVVQKLEERDGLKPEEIAEMVARWHEDKMFRLASDWFAFVDCDLEEGTKCGSNI